MDGHVSYGFFADGSLKSISFEMPQPNPAIHKYILQYIPPTEDILHKWIASLRTQGKSVVVTTTEAGIEFDIFWLKYPRKLDRIRAEEVWKKLSQNERQQAFDLLPEYIKVKEKDSTALSYAKQYLKDKLWRDFIKN